MKSFRKKRGDPPEQHSPTNYHSFQEHSTDMLGSGRGAVAVARGSSLGQDPLVSATFGDICDHRGFTTSIHDLYRDPDMERIDCCAMTCCGILQHDRDRYLIQGMKYKLQIDWLVVLKKIVSRFPLSSTHSL
jgi:hypothetical protein